MLALEKPAGRRRDRSRRAAASHGGADAQAWPRRARLSDLLAPIETLEAQPRAAHRGRPRGARSSRCSIRRNSHFDFTAPARFRDLETRARSLPRASARPSRLPAPACRAPAAVRAICQRLGIAHLQLIDRSATGTGALRFPEDSRRSAARSFGERARPPEARLPLDELSAAATVAPMISRTVLAAGRVTPLSGACRGSAAAGSVS